MKRIIQSLSVTILLLTVTVIAHAQDDLDYEKQEKAVNWYADRAESILTRFEGLRHNAGQLPQKYYAIPYKKAGNLGFALAVSTWDEQEIILFTPDGNNVSGREIAKNEMPEVGYWESISNLGNHMTKSKDITLRERPLPVRSMEKAKNRFEVVIDTEEGLDAGEYKQMIFKPHKNPARLASKHRNLKRDDNGTVTCDATEYIFNLSNPSILSKMFRGYDDGEASPWMVKNSFFDTHNILQYSRWKEGEPKKKGTADVKKIISQYYGGRPIKDILWLASIESAERDFYAVQFEHKGDDALAGMVCVAEGEVVSAWEFHGKADPSGSIWFVDDDGDFIEHAPQIHCIAATDKGLELYVRLFGGESVQYYILREMGSVLMEIQTDMWVYVWD